MFINKLNSFYTTSTDTRGALVNLMIAIQGGGYGIAERNVKSALDANRLSVGISDDDSKDRDNYRSTTEYSDLLAKITKASIKSYIAHNKSLSKKKYDACVKAAMIWLAHSEYWRLLGEEDEEGNPLPINERVNPYEYDDLVVALYNTVYFKDSKILKELKIAAAAAGYDNFVKVLDELGTEVFYMSGLRNARNQWNVLVNRYGPIEIDQDKYGQGPSKLYRSYYDKIIGYSKVDYKELIDACNKVYEGKEDSKDAMTASKLTKLINASLIPYITEVSQSDDEVKALKSLLVNEA